MHQSFVAPGRLPGHLVGSVYDLLRGHVERAHARSRRVGSLPAQAWRRRTVSNVPLGILGLRTSAQARR